MNKDQLLTRPLNTLHSSFPRRRESIASTGLPLSRERRYLRAGLIKGRVEETKGKAKQVTSKILDNEDMEIEGNIQKDVGKVLATSRKISKSRLNENVQAEQ